MNRDELVMHLRDSGSEALAALWSVPADQLQRGGYENGWTVRQIMAHVASMEFAYRRLPDLARGSRDAQTRPDGGHFDMNGYNARQMARRAGASPQELASEFARGRGALIVEIAALDEALLQTPVRSAGGITGNLAEVIEQTAVRHIQAHGADFMHAASASPSAGERIGAALVIAAEEVAARLDGVTERQWKHRASTEDWSAAGISGHVIELMPYWCTQAEQLVGKTDAALGRDVNAPERIGAVVEGEAMTPAQAVEAVRRTANAAATILRQIPADNWQQPVNHHRYGEMSLATCVDRLVVQHVCDHSQQIAGALRGASVL